MTTTPQHALPVGYKLQNYRILEVLGEGGFGITYLAQDELLEQKVAIKEYFPASLTHRDQETRAVAVKQDSARIFQWGLDRFLNEARILAKLSHPNIVRVLYFTALNETGYMVMQYEEGEPLDRWIKRFPDGQVGQSELANLLDPITQALDVVHELGIAHRDVKPANIYIRENGEPVLLDFGAARNTVSGQSKTVAAIVSSGYSPIEQYSDVADQGPWTDIYATAGVAYRLITGKVPPDAPSRIEALHGDGPDPCQKLAENADAFPGYDRRFLASIDHALSIKAQDRPKSIAVWRSGLGFETSGDELAETVLFDRAHAKPVPAGSPGAGSASAAAPALAGHDQSQGGSRAVPLTAAAIALLAIGIGGYFAYEQLSKAPPDKAGESFETAVRIKSPGRTEQVLSEAIGGDDETDVYRFTLQSPAIVTLDLDTFPDGAELAVSEPGKPEIPALEDTGRRSYKLDDGDHMITLTSKNETSEPYEIALSARSIEPAETGSEPSARLTLEAGEGGDTTRHKGIIWRRGEESVLAIDVPADSLLTLSMKTEEDAEAAASLVDDKKLSLARVTSDGQPVKARVASGTYQVVATSRQAQPVRYELALRQDPAPPLPRKTAPTRSARTVMEAPNGISKAHAEARLKQNARAMLLAGRTDAETRFDDKSRPLEKLSKAIPFDENWSINWTGNRTVEASLTARVREIDHAGALSGNVSETNLRAMQPFDVSLKSSSDQEMNVGIFALGADDSVVRIFPIGESKQPLRILPATTRKLSEKVDRLVSAPLPGTNVSDEAVLAVGCMAEADFTALAPAAGEAVSESITNAIDGERFFNNLANFCPGQLSLAVMPYTVSGQK